MALFVRHAEENHGLASWQPWPVLAGQPYEWDCVSVAELILVCYLVNGLLYQVDRFCSLHDYVFNIQTCTLVYNKDIKTLTRRHAGLCIVKVPELSQPDSFQLLKICLVSLGSLRSFASGLKEAKMWRDAMSTCAALLVLQRGLSRSRSCHVPNLPFLTRAAADPILG